MCGELFCISETEDNKFPAFDRSKKPTSLTYKKLSIDIASRGHNYAQIWPAKKVKETHLLVLIPQAVNGQALNLDYLEQLIQNPLGGGHATIYEVYWDDLKKEHGAKPAGQSHWVLMTAGVIPTSIDKPYAQQWKLVRKYAHYQIPQTLEAATCILMEYVKKGKRLYPSSPLRHTFCQERTTGYQNAVGGFGSSGLTVAFCSPGKSVGVGALRKL